MRAGGLDPAAYLEACLARIAEREPTLRVFAWFDPDAARRGLRRAPEGPLHGLPIGVKDVLDTADMPSQYGSNIWAGWRPRGDAACVAGARAQGGVVIGKTVTTEFATRHPGPTANPANPAHTPGGSSSGSAAGVADGMFPLAFGTQTAGSVIRPAAFCGAVGYKPTIGTINRGGMKIMSESLDTIGVMARSVADCALFVGAVAGRDLGDPDVKPARAPRLGLCRSPVWDRAAPETEALMGRIETVLARAGARVRPFELPAPFADLSRAQPIVSSVEGARAMGWELAHHRDGITESLLERLDFGLTCPPEERDWAFRVFAQTRLAFPASLGELDALITPSAPGEAPEGLGWTGDPAFNAIWTALGVPCVTVPAGMGRNALPLGIQIVGRQGDDRATLAWAEWVAAAIG
jgi:Asp-tRNA(Asn)/Glu-tRNA(Gln) amidotransferase A subunit family amidase